MPVILPGASAYGKFLPVFGQKSGGWRVLAGDWAGLSADRAGMRPAVAEWAGEHATAGLTYKTVSGAENVTLARRELLTDRLRARKALPSRTSGTDQKLDD